MSISNLNELLKDFINKTFPKIEEESKYGGILYKLSGQDHFCGVFAYKDHVNVEFGCGYQLSDPKKLLKGSGKYRRHLKYYNADEVNFSDLKRFLKEACKISKS